MGLNDVVYNHQTVGIKYHIPTFRKTNVNIEEYAMQLDMCFVKGIIMCSISLDQNQELVYHYDPS